MSDFDDTPPAESAAEAAQAFLAADAVAPASRPAAVAASVTSRKGLLIGAGALTGALAAAAVVFEQRRRRQDDPWAVPLTDPYGDVSHHSVTNETSNMSGETGAGSNTPVFDAATTDSALVGDAGVNDPDGDLGGLTDVPSERDEQH